MSRRTAGFHHWLIAFVFGVIRHPKRTLALCLIGVGVAAGIAWLRLDVSTDQDQLFSSDVPFFRDYLNFTKAFPENQAGYVVVQARHPDRPPATDRWTAIADAIAAKLAADTENVRSVEARVPIDQLGKQALVFDVDHPAEVVTQAERARAELIPLAQLWGERQTGLRGAALGQVPIPRQLTAFTLAPADQIDANAAQFTDLLCQSWVKVLVDTRRPIGLGDQVPNLSALEASTPRDKGYSYIPDVERPGGHLLLVKVFEQNKLSSLNGLVRVIAGIRKDIAAAAEPFKDEFTVGLSGRPALDADELSTTDHDSRIAEVVSLTAVFIGLAIFLRSIWLAVAAELALLVGIGWTFGWATVSTAAYNRTSRGDLNLLSMVFLIALIGIGMDYLIQVLTRYRQETVRHAADPGRDARSIWAGVFKHVAAPINTACLGAAGAFLVSLFTPFRGAAELGLIAGGGLLLCLATGYIVLPALLTLFPVKIVPTAAEAEAAIVRRPGAAPAAVPAAPVRSRHRRLVWPAVWGALLVAGLPFMLRTSFDPGLLSLQSQSLQSVQLVRKLPTWFNVELSPDLDVLRRVRDAVVKLPTVDHTESVLTAIRNYEYLTAHPLPNINWVDPPAVGGDGLTDIASRAEALANRFASTGAADIKPYQTAAASLRAFALQLRSVHGDAAGELAALRLTRWQEVFVDELKTLVAPFHPDPPDVTKAPDTLRGHLLGTDGRFALYIYPKGDCWKQAELAAFVTTVENAVKSVPNAPPVTGVAMDVFHSTDQTAASFHHATLYALALIFVLVLIDLRNLWQTLFAISVLALGLPMLVAVMGLLHINWNFANFFGLPILIGAGHEYGVFMVHRYNEACRDPHRPWRRWDVSDRALLLCGYVTSISFGFFYLFGHHLGLKSLGLVMALGIACIYLATLCVLRPLLLWKLAGGSCGIPTAAAHGEPARVA